MIILNREVDLNVGPKAVERLSQVFAVGNADAHTFRVRLLRGGAGADITGVVQAYVKHDRDNSFEVIDGTMEGSTAVVTLPTGCYLVEGHFTVGIMVADALVYAFDGMMTRFDGEVFHDPEGRVPDITELLAEIATMREATKQATAATAKATTAATNADAKAQAAQTAADTANSAAENAIASKNAADAAAGKATTAATNADAKAQAAQTATNEANAAAANATASKDAADAAKARADAAAALIEGMTFSAETREYQSGTTVALSEEGDHYHAVFGVERGKPGTGHVSSVCKVEPGEDGDVPLTIGDIPGGLTGRIEKNGEIVTIRDAPSGVGLDVISEIAVTQEGSGTPSADNVRAFVPWTNATLDVAGVNLIPWAVPGKTFNGNGMTGEIDADGAVINGTPTNNYAQLNYQSALLRPGTYTPNGGEANKFYFNLYLFETLGGSAIGTSNYGGKVVTLDEPTNVQIKMQASTVANTGTLENYRLAPMLTLADQALADGEFVPYIGQKYTKALGQSVYGGSYNWATGELTITAAHIASYNGEALPGMWRCDRAVYDAGTTPPTGSEVVYELADPQVVQVGTPQTIQTIAGINNVWSSTGMTQVVGFGKVLSVNNLTPDENGNVQLTAADVGARPDTWTPTAADVGALPSTGSAETYRPIIDLIFYVGRIVQCATEVDPNTLFPWQTWARIKDVFLMASGDTNAVGSTGGEAMHTLSIEEMPRHAHVVRIDWTDRTPEINALTVNGEPVIGLNGVFGYAGLDRGSTTRDAGGNQPHNNLPPYLAVCVWKRTA